MNYTTNRTARASTLLLAAISVTACAHVGQEDLDSRLTGLRDDMTREIRAGDDGVRMDLGRRMDGLEGSVEALRSDLAALEQEFDITVQELETALRFNVPVYFQFDDATVQPRGRDVLNRFADVAGTYYPQAHITVEGFTDPSGGAEYNLRLGERRAESVKAYIVGRGLPAEMVRAVSYGEDNARLIVDGAHGPGISGWENRRVVLVIDHGGTAEAATITSGGDG